MASEHAPQWLTLSEAAKRFGVHPSTLRTWANKGQLPVRRTKGGHRRFLSSELDLWESAEKGPSREASSQLVQTALGMTQYQISEGALEGEDWYTKLDSKAHEEYRASGAKLVQGLINFVASEGERALAEAHAVGFDYAMLGRRHSLDSLDAVHAFLFFRKSLQESLLRTYETALVQSPHAWADMSRKVGAFTDRVLLSVLETYRSFEKD